MKGEFYILPNGHILWLADGDSLDDVADYVSISAHPNYRCVGISHHSLPLTRRPWHVRAWLRLKRVISRAWNRVKKRGSE